MSSLSSTSGFLLLLMALVVFATAAPLRVRPVLAMSAGAAAGFALAHFGWIGEAMSIGCIVIAVVCLHLWTRWHEAALAVGIGLLVACCQAWLVGHGVGAWLAAVSALLAGMAIVLVCRRHTYAAPGTMQTEAMLLLLVLAVFVAAAPEVTAGWQSAVALNASAIESSAEASLPDLKFPLLLCAVAIAAGAGHSIWERCKRC